MPDIRPMTLDDTRAALELMIETFEDLDRRHGREPEPPPPDAGAAEKRFAAFVRHDPEGSWVAEDEQGLAGCALAVKREGIWGLSLLVVRPGLQSAGVGSALLRRAHDYAHDAVGRIILASPDPRAVRAYARLGLDLHPLYKGSGTPRGMTMPAGLRDGDAADVPLTEVVDRFARGGGRRSSIETLLDMGQRLLVLPERGYAVFGNGELRTLAALDDESAATLLRGVLARAEGDFAVHFLPAAQRWALPVLLEAGLDVAGTAGPLFLGGDVGGFAPYVPSGAFL
jgi:GNAT superfamily N-acetyltransferase